MKPRMPALRRILVGTPDSPAAWRREPGRGRSPTLGAQRSATSVILANRPVAARARFVEVIVATLATGAFLVVNTSTWSIADHLSTTRLLVLSVLSVAALAVCASSLELFERPTGIEDQPRVRRANTATAITLP
jgi:hypothetical protein